MPYESDIEICLVTKSDVQETEKLIQKNNIPYIKKVNTYHKKIEKLKIL